MERDELGEWEARLQQASPILQVARNFARLAPVEPKDQHQVTDYMSGPALEVKADGWWPVPRKE